MSNVYNKKALTKVNENSIFYKVKRFFKTLFNNKNEVEQYYMVEEKDISATSNTRNLFAENIRNSAENEETKLLKLQKEFENGKVKEEELSENQKVALSALYDIQIANLKKSNAIRRNRIEQCRRKFQTEN